MLFALDVGNTSITVGLFQGKRITFRGRLPTHGTHSYRDSLRKLLGKRARSIDGVIISSVVPKATRTLKKALQALHLPTPLVFGENIKAPVINRYRIPSQVGQDRLVNAAAAFFLYRGPCIIVDFGTAITIDLVSKRREYLGGVIFPGMELALETLTARAALLPEIRLTPPKEFLGRDTVSSMKSGIFYGTGALCDGIVAHIKRKDAPRAKVVATGGHARLIAPFCRTIQIVSPDLTLRGLALIYQSR